MTFRAGLFASTTLLGMAGLLSGQAHAGLLGVGGTVQAFYYNGTLAGPAGLIPDGFPNSNPAPLTVPLDFTNNVSLTNIHVGDTRITLANTAPGAFCFAGSSGTACTDQINGFDFLFTGENILGVSVDPTSAPAFLPVTGTFQNNTHLGLQLLSNNEIRVDVTGDAPAVGDQLILDLSFTVPPPPPPPPPPVRAPEPGTLALLGSALVVLNAVRRRKDR